MIKLEPNYIMASAPWAKEKTPVAANKRFILPHIVTVFN
jgi:hypothetical protein